MARAQGTVSISNKDSYIESEIVRGGQVKEAIPGKVCGHDFNRFITSGKRLVIRNTPSFSDRDVVNENGNGCRDHRGRDLSYEVISTTARDEIRAFPTAESVIYTMTSKSVAVIAAIQHVVATAPSIRSMPDSPASVSLPLCPFRMSSPSPPSSESLPPPRMAMSSPASHSQCRYLPGR